MSSFAALRASRDARHAPLRHGVGSVDPSASSPALKDAAGSVHAPAGSSALHAPASTDTITSSGEVAPPPPPEPQTMPSPETMALFPELASTPLEVRVSPTSGRGLYATRAISAGSIILTTTPVVGVLSNTHLATACSACWAVKKVSRCAACKAAHYCSATCQRADWPQHKPECAALKRLCGMWARTYPAKAKDGSDLSWVMNEAVRALGRMCWRRRAERGVDGSDPEWWTQVAGMESHTKTLPEKDMIKLAGQVQHLRHYLDAAVPSATPDVLHPADPAEYGFDGAGELLDMCSAFVVNSFTLATGDIAPVGVATSPLCALFNHSCEPNAVVVFPRAGEGMKAVAIADVQPGEEVLTSYIDLSLPYVERRGDLHDRYGFDCVCTLCARNADPSFVDPRWCLLHPGCASGGRGRMPDLRHQGDATVRCSCGETLVVDVPPLRVAIETGKQILVQDESGTLDEAGAQRTLAQLTPRLAALMPPSAHPLLQLLRLQALLLTPPSTPAEQAIVVGLLTAAAAGAKESHPPHHPTVGIILATRAKIMAMDMSTDTGNVMLDARGKAAKVEQLTAAVQALREAIAACDAGLGRDGDVSRDLQGVLGTCERELDMLRR